MSRARQYLEENSRDVVEGERIESSWILCEPEGIFRALKLTGTDEAHWYPRFHELQAQDGQDKQIRGLRFFEILPPTAHTKLSVVIPANSPSLLRQAYCMVVPELLLSKKGRDAAELSFWYQLDDYIYGVWPCIGLSHSGRAAAVYTICSQWHQVELGMPTFTKPTVNEIEQHFAHYGARLRFPLPGEGTRWIGAFDREGLELRYSSRHHRECYGHLAVDGGFAFSRDAEILNQQSLTLFTALRIGNLEGCVHRNGKLKDPGFSADFRVETTKRAVLQRNRHAPVSEVLGEEEQAPQEPLPRLDWSDGDIFSHRDCVGQLRHLIATQPQHNYRAAFAQLNRWFLKEGYGVNVPLYYKGYDTKKLPTDPVNHLRFVRLVKTSKSDVAARLNGVKIKVNNSVTGKEHEEPIFSRWLEHEALNVVAEIVVNPVPSLSAIELYPQPGNCFNSWRGWDFYRLGYRDKLHAQHKDKSLKELFALDAVRDINALMYGILCNGEVDTFRIATLILANILQFPNDPCRKAMAFVGPEGSGKSILSDAFVERVFGFNHSVIFSDPAFVVGNFTNMRSGKVFCVVEEAFFGGDKASSGKLKQTITGLWQMLNEKYGDIREELNMSTYWLNTNLTFFTAIGEDGRRWVVATVSKLVKYLKDTQKVGFFAKLIEHLQKTDGVFEYAYFLSRLNLEVWMRDRKGYVHLNHGLAMQKAQTMATENPVHTWLADCIANRSLGIMEDWDTVPDADGNRKRKPTYHHWGQEYSQAQLFNLFKKASSRSAFVTIDTFKEQLLEALCDCPPGAFDIDVPTMKVQLRSEDPLEEDPEAVRKIKMPSADEAKKSLQRAIPGLELASGTEYGKKALNDAKRNRTLASFCPTPASLLPEENPFETLFVTDNRWKCVEEVKI